MSLRRLFEPVDISFLAFQRIAFGGIMLWEVLRYATKGWISRYYVEPGFFFHYYGFGWIRPWDGSAMFIHFAVLGILAVFILLGLFYRVAAALFFFGFTYVFLLDQTRYLNHFYLISLISFLFILLPAERAFSLDVRRRPSLRLEKVPAWTLWLLRFQIAVPYFFGGVAKLNKDWLQGEPMRIWMARRTDFPVIGSFFTEEGMVYLFVMGGLLLDLLIVPFLLWKRTRLAAYAVAVAFHVTNAFLFSIGIFPWFMIVATLVFFPPDWPRRLARRLGFSGVIPAFPVTDETRTLRESRLSGRQKSVAAALALYATFQILFPLRHFLYSGNVNWTEEGHRFSWHMKLRTKTGEGYFLVTDPGSGQSWEIDPDRYLTSRQVGKMMTHPDMLLQFAHYLAEEKKREGYGEVEVSARVMASLNGREPQFLVDPTVDLAKKERNLWPADWILPLLERPRHY